MTSLRRTLKVQYIVAHLTLQYGDPVSLLYDRGNPVARCAAAHFLRYLRSRGLRFTIEMVAPDTYTLYPRGPRCH